MTGSLQCVCGKGEISKGGVGGESVCAIMILANRQCTLINNTPPKAFLEAIYLFAHGLPTADVWQDDAWRQRLETQQVQPARWVV
jgi:hypothetical protein